MRTTRIRARELGLHWTELEPVADIDNRADLTRLPAEWLTQ